MEESHPFGNLKGFFFFLPEAIKETSDSLMMLVNTAVLQNCKKHSLS